MSVIPTIECGGISKALSSFRLSMSFVLPRHGWVMTLLMPKVSLIIVLFSGVFEKEAEEVEASLSIFSQNIYHAACPYMLSGTASIPTTSCTMGIHMSYLSGGRRYAPPNVSHN